MKMITMVRFSDADFREYRIYLKDFVQQYDLSKTKSSYDLLREAANSLLRKEVTIEHEDEHGVKNETRTHLIIGATTQAKGQKLSYIELSFHPQLKPHLLALRDRFTIYDLQNVQNLSSSYSIRIYELLKQYEKIGHRTLELNELKSMIGARVTYTEKGKEKIKDTCPQYGSLNQKILKPAQKNLLESTDICFEVEPIKEGRKVVKLKFIIMRNPKLDPVAQPADAGAANSRMEQEAREALIARLYVRVDQFVDEAAVKKWVDKHPEDQIQYAINYTLAQVKAGKKIDNVGGYLHKMITTDALMTTRKAEEKKRRAAEVRKQKKQKQLAAIEGQYWEVEQNIRLKKEDVIRGIFDRHPSAKLEAFETAKKRRHGGYDPKRTNAENMVDGLFRATFISIIRKRYPEHFAEVNELEKWAGKLRAKLNRLKD